jgi:hypothetical protein
MTRLEVQVDIDEGPADAGQLAAWQRLWKWLLADEPENSNAPGSGPEASADGTVAQPYREDLDERPEHTTP